MFKKAKVIQLFFINLFLSGVFCDVSELKISSTTENYDVPTTTNNIQNYAVQTDYSENPSSVNSRISLFENTNDTPQNYQLPQDVPSPRSLGISNEIVPRIYKQFENPNNQLFYSNGCGQNIQCNPGYNLFRNTYNRPIIPDRPILDATVGNLGYQYQPNNLGTTIYTRPSYTGNLGQNVYNRPNVVDKPIYQYNGNVGQNVISQPANRCCIGGSNIDQQVVNHPSSCCDNGNVGQHVISQPSYYPSNNGRQSYYPSNNGRQSYYPSSNIGQPSYYPPNIGQPSYYPPNKPCTPCNRDDTVEIINGYYYPKPIYPTYLPPTYSTTPQNFPPATARISA